MKFYEKFIALTGLVSGFVMFAWIFISAIIDGGVVCVNVNKYHEMYLELAIILILSYFVVKYVYHMIWIEGLED